MREEGAPQDDVVYLSLDDDFFVAVSTVCIQLWSGGQHRVRLGILRRGPDSVASEGLNRRAFWCGARRLLAVLTYGNVLHVYGLHWTKEPALPLGAALEVRAAPPPATPPPSRPRPPAPAPACRRATLTPCSSPLCCACCTGAARSQGVSVIGARERVCGSRQGSHFTFFKR